MVDPRQTEPVEGDHYVRRREVLERISLESISEYARLVSWAALGALAASMLFVGFRDYVDPETGWLLEAGWALVVAAFTTALLSHGVRSRLHAWRLSELDHLQIAPAERLDTWPKEAVRRNRLARRYAAIDQWLMLLSSVMLIAGLACLTSFAFRNVPFEYEEDMDEQVVSPRTAISARQDAVARYSPSIGMSDYLRRERHSKVLNTSTGRSGFLVRMSRNTWNPDRPGSTRSSTHS